MKKAVLYTLSVFLCMQFATLAHAQADNIGKKNSDKNLIDSTQVALLISAANELRAETPDSALIVYEAAFSIARKNNMFNFMADIKNSIALVHVSRMQFKHAITNYQEMLDYTLKASNDKKIASAYINMANIYVQISELDKALKYFTYALEIKEKIADKKGVAVIHNNLARIYDMQDNQTLSIESYEKAMYLFEEINQEDYLSIVYANLANIYSKKSNFLAALAYYQKAEELKRKLQDERGLIAIQLNSANALIELGQVKKGLDICLALKDKIEVLGNIELKRFLSTYLAQAYEKLGKYDKAFFYLKEAHNYEKEINNANSSEDAFRQSMQFDFNRQLYIDSLKREEIQRQKDIEQQQLNMQKEQEVKQLRLYTYAGVAGFLFMIVIAVILLRANANKKKANDIITKQKQEVEIQKELVQEKNKEVLDSITYAKRIQEALLPDDDFFRDILPQSFILYKPRDIVSGDFYWLETIEKSSGGKYIFLAVADCTGHGVPGAFMSIIGHNGLNRCIGEFALRKPNEILDRMGELIRTAVHHHKQAQGNVYDGMDISLCRIETSGTNQIQEILWAGANSPLYVVNDNNLQIFKADAQPLGAFINERIKPFTLHTIPANKGDMLYLFSDGYADQFGGPKGKKFKYENFRKLLSAFHKHPLPEQKQQILDTMEDWKGQLEQVDDICVIGFRI